MWNQQCSTMKDSEFLLWLFERFHYVYHESEYFDYMIRFKQIIEEVKRQEDAQ